MAVSLARHPPPCGAVGMEGGFLVSCITPNGAVMAAAALLILIAIQGSLSEHLLVLLTRGSGVVLRSPGGIVNKLGRSGVFSGTWECCQQELRPWSDLGTQTALSTRRVVLEAPQEHHAVPMCMVLALQQGNVLFRLTTLPL